MSAKKLYDRLVGLLYSHWAKLYPMQEWVDPEGATDRVVAELLQLRGERERCAKIAEEALCGVNNPEWWWGGYALACQEIAARIREGQ